MRFIRSCKYAWAGLQSSINMEKNLQLEIFVTISTFLLGFYFRITANEWIAILLCCAIVLSMEIMNTSLEKLANIVCPSKNADIKLVKDIAAGAVFMASGFSFIIAAIIFFAKIKIMFLHEKEFRSYALCCSIKFYIYTSCL